MVWYLNKTLLWAMTIGFGKLGVMFSTFFVMFSASMTGAGMSLCVCVCTSVFVCITVSLSLRMCVRACGSVCTHTDSNICPQA